MSHSNLGIFDYFFPKFFMTFEKIQKYCFFMFKINAHEDNVTPQFQWSE